MSALAVLFSGASAPRKTPDFAIPSEPRSCRGKSGVTAVTGHSPPRSHRARRAGAEGGDSGTEFQGPLGLELRLGAGPQAGSHLPCGEVTRSPGPLQGTEDIRAWGPGSLFGGQMSEDPRPSSALAFSLSDPMTL